jgi:ATP-dependent RNA circularization protein (DNA/RNA ligase family)
MADGTPQFIPFPKTPHMTGSAVVDDDQTLNAADFAKWFKNATRLVVQEKVDGANVSVHFEQEWVPVLQKRSGLIDKAEKQQYNVFRDYVFEHLESLFSLLSTRYCLFGEWLWNQHAVAYQTLPSYLLIFDIFDKQTNEWMSRERMEIFFGDYAEEFFLVPNLASLDLSSKQIATNATQQIQSLLKRQSNFSNEDQEGVYIRVEDETHVIFRAKLRRATFTPGREDFNRIINNGLRS